MEAYHRAVLQKSFFFDGIDGEECAKLISCLCPQVKHYVKNEIILLMGDLVQHIGIVLAGNACAYLEHINGNRTLISNLTPMSVFGEVLVSTRTHRSPVTVYAASGATAAFIEYERIHSMCGTACAAHRLFLQNMLKAIGDKYFILFDRINILREKSLRMRVMAYLHSLSGRGGSKTVALPFSKTMLADYLLVNRSALSKELRKMQCDGIITVKGRVIEII